MGMVLGAMVSVVSMELLLGWVVHLLSIRMSLLIVSENGTELPRPVTVGTYDAVASLLMLLWLCRYLVIW